VRVVSTVCLIGLFATMSPASAADASLASILQRRGDALVRMHVVAPRSLELNGTLSGLGTTGTFHRWIAGSRERYDQSLGARSIQNIRIGERRFVRNSYGDVMQAGGGEAVLRQRTADWIDANNFVRHPETAELLGAATLDDGRSVYRLRVSAPDGQAYGIALDAASSMIDEMAYPDGNGITTTDYYDYRVSNGALYAQRQVESNGDRALDVSSAVTSVQVDRPIADAIFEVPQSVRIETAVPVTVPLLVDRNLTYVRASVGARPLLLLIDSGSQGIVLSPDAASRLGLRPQGTIEIRGARQTNGAGIAPLDAIDIGAVRLPVNVVSVVDLNGLSYEGKSVDGVLGYPFFAAAEVRIDPDDSTLTIAQPGALPVRGSALPIEVGRQVPEIIARINNKIDGRFVVDTGNNSDLLVFHAFVEAHPGVVFYGGARNFAANRGVGGSSAAVPVSVDRLQLGPFTLYNRYANVLLADRGAFAEGADAGNIGYGSLRNFIVTFDAANGTLYLEKARWFDDGRYRPQYEPAR
jgi:hypothetical protein